MKKATLFFAAAVLAVAVAAAPAYAAKGGGGDGGGGSPASNKAYFGTTDGPVMFVPFDASAACGDTGFDQPNDRLCTPWQTIYYVDYALKTSTNGGVGVYVSLECSLWTDSEASAKVGATGSGGSRAGVEVRVMVNGSADWVEAKPGTVVFCDRLQYLELTVPLLWVDVPLVATINPDTGEFTTEDETLSVYSNEPFIVGLFQRTKNAHSFNFYQATGAAEVGVMVQARGIVQCFKDGKNADCKDSGIDIPKFVDGDGAQDPIAGGTKAVIGKASFVIDEHNNWNSSTFTP